MTDHRSQSAESVRNSAARMSAERPRLQHLSNGDEERYASEHYPMSFSKGLEHCGKTGLVKAPEDFRAFRRAIDGGRVDAFSKDVNVSSDKERKWEAPTAGYVYDLQGPDCQAVTMPPAPALGSTELAYEMAEVYELALLRDQPLSSFAENSGNTVLQNSLDRLNEIGFDISGAGGTRPRKGGTGCDAGNVTKQTAFRGSSPGVDQGPYLSQFLLLGNRSAAGDLNPEDGIVAYGAQRIDQRVPRALSNDFMTTWNDWLDVQNGKNTQKGGEEALFGKTIERRFICTPRDLATYVHYDALYQAYLNACLILLGMKAPTDPGFDHLSGGGKLSVQGGEPREPESGGFALWGGPHILTLVTEVATRALKAVRFQKFNVHCRLRPEVLAARIHRCDEIAGKFPCVGTQLRDLRARISPTVQQISQKNNEEGNALLPMAFQEGSPMHPAYGAGHATVAGACVTILKAFFDTSAVLVKRKQPACDKASVMFARKINEDQPVAFVAECDAECDSPSGLKPVECSDFLTLEGELNKLAANISIGRNMAGVHYFSDYYDSLRLGEAVAIGMLEEQALCYPNDAFVFSLPTFDGAIRRIGAGG